MVSIMSYQYPLPLPPNGSEVDLSQSAYAPIYNAPAPGPPLMVPRSQEPQSLKERKESFAQASLALKRSRSTPNVRHGQANMSDSNQPGLAGDKKRNKLGYHRTSVACGGGCKGHCRRRKIRCIPSPADIQGRCINCIRLKKECSFHPVDQPPQPPPQPIDAQSKAPSRAPTVPKIASASCSPAMAPGQSPERAQYQQYHPAAVPQAQNITPHAMRPPTVDTFGSEAEMPAGASSTSQPFEFPSQTTTSWIQSNVNPGSEAKLSNLNEPWRSFPQESPIPSSFSPYTNTQGPSSSSWGTNVNADLNVQEQMGWSSFVPSASIPYPGDVQLSSQYAAIPQQESSYGRKSSAISVDTYPAQIATSVSRVDPPNASLSAGAVPTSGYGLWDQTYTYNKTNEGYNSWGYEDNVGN